MFTLKQENPPKDHLNQYEGGPGTLSPNKNMHSKDFAAKMVVEKINDDFNKLSTILSEEEYAWIEGHRDCPHIVEVIIDLNSIYTIKVWQITKNTNEEESYHIAYNPSTRNYGIIVFFSSGLKWYMGDYGTLYETYKAL